MNLPTLCTLLRITLLVPIVVLITQQLYLFATLLFCVASLLDWVDGKLARLLHQQSKLGAMLDHIADKILITGTIAALLYSESQPLLLACLLCIVGRDLVLAGMRELWLQTGQTQRAKVNFVGKWKTTVQMTGIVLLLALYWWQIAHYQQFVQGILIVISLVTLLSLVGYIRLPTKNQG